MPKTKVQKQEILKDLKEKSQKSKSVVFAAIDGLKAKDLFDLRKKLKAAGCVIKVAKKTLINMAFKENKISADVEKIAGQLALIFGQKDEVAPARVAYQFSLQNKNLKILGGILENNQKLQDEIIDLAKLPSKEILLGRLVGSIASPMSGLANVLQGNIKGLVYALSRIKK